MYIEIISSLYFLLYLAEMLVKEENEIGVIPIRL